MRWLLICIVPLIASSVAYAAETFPPEIMRAIGNQCDGKADFKPGFATRENITGDERKGYVLNFENLYCSNLDGSYCGTDGCLKIVFAPLPNDHFKQVFRGYVKGDIDFISKDGRRLMKVLLEGTSCGKEQNEFCPREYYWDGHTLKEEK